MILPLSNLILHLNLSTSLMILLSPFKPSMMLARLVIVFEYFVCWKDLPESENSWIPLSDIPTSQNELIDCFHHRHPQAPRPHTIALNQTFSIPPTTNSPSVSIELTPQTSSPHTDSMLAIPQASSTPLAIPIIPPTTAHPASPPVIHQRLRSEYVPPIQTMTRTGRVSKPAQHLDPEH